MDDRRFDSLAKSLAAGQSRRGLLRAAFAAAAVLFGDKDERPETAESELRSLGLTGRQVEVLKLVAAGLTDREIADRLFIARRTASKHVEAILAKLGVPSRRAATAEARRLGLS